MPPSATAEILPTHTAELFRAAVRRAAELLRSGEVVALPTETVYGLAANALDPAAVAKIYEIKGRPAHNPIIVHVASIEMAKRCAASWPAAAGKLAKSFWPGPLTIVLQRAGGTGVPPVRFPDSRDPKRAGETPAPRPSSEISRRDAGSMFCIPDIVTAAGSTVGIRWPSHPFIQAAIRECGFPLAAPSANLSNRVSPTTAEHVHRQLGNRIRLIVDGGHSQVGIESTVLDLASDIPRVLRPGMIHDSALEAVLGNIERPTSNIQHRTSESGERRSLRSPGMLPKHYAPNGKLLILHWEDDADLRRQLRPQNANLETCFVIAHSRIPSAENFGRVSVIPHDPEAFARALYAELHQCDEAGAEWIAVETPPETEEWRGITDRLRRAAAGATPEKPGPANSPKRKQLL